MIFNFKKVFILMFLILSRAVFSNDVIIKGIEFLNSNPNENTFKINVEGDFKDNPKITIKDNQINLILNNAHIKNKISKILNKIGTKAKQLDRSTVEINFNLNYSIKGHESLVNLFLKENYIELKFPIIKALSKIEKEKTIDNEILDENYLKELEAENNKKTLQNDTDLKKDKVDLVQSAPIKIETPYKRPVVSEQNSKKSEFSIAKYVGKFVAFLGLMLVILYGALAIFKKGALKKGSLGFFNSTKMIEVLNTTHIAPKRSLMIVKAHKQVFLISNTETGMNLISEVSDVSGLIKSGEKEVTGNNFDSELENVSNNKIEKVFHLKNNENVESMIDEELESKKYEELTKDKVKFSDQIKSKIKNLKQIQ